MKRISDFIGESKGSSQAISKALLFIMLLALLSGGFIGASTVISDQQTQAAYDQNIRTFVDYDDNVNNVNDEQGFGFANTATITQRISTYGGRLNLGSTTSIDIENVSGTITSKSLILQKDRYDVVYDAKLIGGRTVEQEYTISTPVDGRYTNEQDSVIPLITTNYSRSNMFEGSTNAQTILISREYSPETKMVRAGRSIDVTTEHQFMWEDYFRNHQSIDYIQTSGDTVEGEITRESKIYHYQVRVAQSVQ